jgi:thiol-disulfide isomerase/thioredoxin
LELLAKSKDALASAEKIDDDAKRKEAVDRLKRSLTKLYAGPMKGPIIDKPAPEVTLEWVHDANGPVTLADLDSLKGKIVILDFWATWCGPCVASFPKIRELRAHYPGDDVVILGVTSLQGKHYPRGASPIDCAGDPAKERQLMTEYMKVMEITWPIAFSAQDVFNADYDVNGIPHVAIIDAKGVLRHNNLHPASPLDEKTKLIDALLVEAGKTPPAKPQPQP